MQTPESLRYAETHEWARREPDGTIVVGISDHAQEVLGELVYLKLPEAGARLAKGEACMVIESVKAAADGYSPVSGEVVAVNAEAAEHPESVNKDPYGTWLIRVRPGDAAEFDALLDASAYRKVAESDAHQA